RDRGRLRVGIAGDGLERPGAVVLVGMRTVTRQVDDVERVAVAAFDLRADEDAGERDVVAARVLGPLVRDLVRAPAAGTTGHTGVEDRGADVVAVDVALLAREGIGAFEARRVVTVHLPLRPHTPGGQRQDEGRTDDGEDVWSESVHYLHGFTGRPGRRSRSSERRHERTTVTRS